MHNICDVQPLGTQLSDTGTPNSTALRWANNGRIYQAKTYGADENVIARIDFYGDPHYIKGIGYTIPHVHPYYYWNGYRNNLPIISLSQYMGGL